MNCTITGKTTTPEQFVLQRRIGSTLYRVRAHFSETSKETVDDKILRLLKNELLFSPKSATMESLQTGRLSERSSA